MANYSQRFPVVARLAFCATLLALVVIMFGAYTRLKEAGLGCPDWPGCYGQLQVPKTLAQLAKAQAAYPQQPLESGKAWAEMTHRYLAGTLVLLIFSLIGMLYRRRHRIGFSFLPPSLLLIALVVFQATLGMWTVTLLLYPPVVMGHLLAGMAILGTLWWLTLLLIDWKPPLALIDCQKFLIPALIALLIVIAQIALGGWTSANYAGPACPDFPFCQGQLLPAIDLQKGFNWWLPVGANFQGGLLDNAARMAIHVVHRFGALFTLLYMGALALALLVTSNRSLRLLGMVLAGLLLLQIALGILFVTLHFPLAIGVLHNGGAALLLLAVITLNMFLYRYQREARRC